MSDIERCDVCGQPMGTDESAESTVCNSTRCYTSLVRAKAAIRGVSVEEVLKQDRSLAAGLEVAKAVHPVGLFDEESGDGLPDGYRDCYCGGVSPGGHRDGCPEAYAEGKMEELANNGGTVGDTYIPPVKRAVTAHLPAFSAPYGKLVAMDYADVELRAAGNQIHTIDSAGGNPQLELYARAFSFSNGVVPFLPPGGVVLPPGERLYTQAEVDSMLSPKEDLGDGQFREVSPDEMNSLGPISVTYPDDELQRLRQENSDLQSALGRVQHVAEEKARYWEVRCEYAETALSTLVAAVDINLGDLISLPYDVEVANEQARSTLRDRETRGIEDLEKTLRDRRQTRILDTARRLWGVNADVDNIVERAIRFFEESVELLQAVAEEVGPAWWDRVPELVWDDFAKNMIDRAYKRPPGSVTQEAAGCYFTLAAFCEAAKLSGQELEVNEAIRVSKLDPTAAVAKHQSKLAEGI